MVLTVLPIPLFPGEARAQDDLTHELTQIMTVNAILQKAAQEASPAGAFIIRQFIESLQKNTDCVDAPTAKPKEGQPIKAIAARLQGKEGCVRRRLMVKRIDLLARTVIKVDPNFELDQAHD
ncbi:hypothetical protein NliqN6_2294 [Naganishia liquefaciens]|uniref:DNA-directed RNA polymerase n=1 Tax=Naganishia liquefaciens TaxID=104408 RepID=A0A8H3TRI1_9TREE|nr:hypothetical protein NliqN6_2294 [Naganishia liquefaciens]